MVAYLEHIEEKAALAFDETIFKLENTAHDNPKGHLTGKSSTLFLLILATFQPRISMYYYVIRNTPFLFHSLCMLISLGVLVRVWSIMHIIMKHAKISFKAKICSGASLPLPFLPLYWSLLFLSRSRSHCFALAAESFSAWQPFEAATGSLLACIGIGDWPLRSSFFLSSKGVAAFVLFRFSKSDCFSA